MIRIDYLLAEFDFFFLLLLFITAHVGSNENDEFMTRDEKNELLYQYPPSYSSF
jgi:hypothetical protein